MNIKNLFEGRLGRKSYLYSIVVLMSAFFVLLFTFIFIQSTVADYLGWQNIYIDLALILLPFILFYFYRLSIDVRRFHDIGYSGYLSLIHFIPYLGLFVTLFLLFKKGVDNQNEYGEPKNDFIFSDTFKGSRNVEFKQENKMVFIVALFSAVYLIVLVNFPNPPLQKSDWSTSLEKEQLDVLEDKLIGSMIAHMLLK